MDPYDDLRTAVLRQAVKDYKYNPIMRSEVLDFVDSELFEFYSDNIDRDTFKEYLQKIAPF